MKKSVFLAIMLLAPTVCVADNVCKGEGSCEDLPACETLGYTKNRYCPEGYITCPFDTDYIWCKTYECGMGGYMNAPKTDAANDPDRVAIANKKAQGYICKKVKFHGIECYECDTLDGNICKYDDVNKGEGTLKGQPCGNGKYPECESNCADRDKTADILGVIGAIPIHSICTACGIDEAISTDFICDESYLKEEAADGIMLEDGKKYTCVPEPCPTATTYVDIPYEATGSLNCKTKGHNGAGWRYETNGVSGRVVCSRCVPKDCPLGSEPNLSSCPNETGYLYIANGYSGDAPCGYCESLRCADPYTEAYQSIADCKTLGNASWAVDKAWTFETSTQQAGNKVCGLCVPKECNTGYSKTYQSLNDCDNKVGYEFKYDASRFYGDKYCGKCEEKACPTDTKTNMSLTECAAKFGSEIGTRVTQTDTYSGTARCQKCECDASECLWKASDIGPDGEGVNKCCDGLSYQSCSSPCTGDEVVSIENAQKMSKCTACGHTYLTVEECNYGYKIENNKCVQKNCTDWGLKSKESECLPGFMAVLSEEHPQCYSCEVKTCADWGGEVNQTWYEPSVSSCPEGYEKTIHSSNVGGTQENCFDCEKCASKSGYITVNSEADIPSYVVVKEKFKSCNKYQYCAASCQAGYTLNGCACEPTNCSEYLPMNGLKQVSGNIWTDATGALKYELCQTGAQKLYKPIGCMDGFSNTTCNGSIGEYASGSENDSFKCYKCLCNVAIVKECQWTSANMDGGKGSSPCCDGTTYKNCTQDTTKCSYTLTEKPQNAKTTQTCDACGKTYYKVTECNTGYTGETCSNCASGYGSCNGKCSLKPNCESGIPVCSKTGWVCGCTTGYTGDLCNECNEAIGFYRCKGVCLQQPLCIHGTPTCESDGWKCGCDSCYTGTTCDTCDDGCKDFGEGCVPNNACNGHGTYDGTTCKCDTCYTGDSCDTLDTQRCRDGQPKTCESESLSTSYNPTCQNWTPATVETVGGTLNCFNVTNKGCADFCGKYDIISSKVSVESAVANCNGIQGTAKVYAAGDAVYAWLKASANGSSVSKAICGKTCYFDDSNCSSGEKLSSAQKADREAQGYVCQLSGYTPAGSTCYLCNDNKCPDGLVNENDIVQKQAAGYQCTEVQNVQTSSGKGCYRCLDDTCEEGDVLSEEEITKFYDDDFVLADVHVYQNEAGHYCYKVTGNERDCTTTTFNTTYMTSRACETRISSMKDYGAYETDTAYVSAYRYAPAASCHQCVTSNGQKKLLWYPSCRQAYDDLGTLLRNYAEIPQDNGLTYQNGSNCCLKEYKKGDPVFEVTNINMDSYKLGSGTKAETCYVLADKCGISLMEDDYCTKVKCLVVNCSTGTYPYYNDGNGTSTIPLHSSPTGNSCTNVTESCVSGPVFYDDFKCDQESHVKNSAGTACECDDGKHGKYYYNTEEKCLSARYTDGHVCKFDSEVSDCWVRGDCNGEGYYTTENDCVGALKGHICHYDKLSTECWIDSGCNTKEKYYDKEETCMEGNKGHKCVVGEDTTCYVKGECNDQKGYYKTNNDCKDGNTGWTCGYDEETECYIKDKCNKDDKYYDSTLECEEDNTGFKCDKDMATGCVVISGCNTDLNYYDLENDCKKDNPWYKCPKDDETGCFVKGGCADGYHLNSTGTDCEKDED